MTVNDLTKLRGVEPVNLADPGRQITGGYVGDLLSWVMGSAKSGDVWITIMTNVNIAAVATLADTACILLAEGVALEDNVVQVIREKGINVLRSERAAFELAGEISGML